MKKILLIEDNLQVQENTQAMLELAGYKVETAINGTEGLKKAVQFIPDIILCDILMPQMDGYDVLEKIRRKKNISSTPFIFLTALSKKSDVRKGMNLGADDYVTKPFTDTEIIEAIESRLKKREFLKKNFIKNLNGINSFFKEASQYVEMERLSENRELERFEAKETIFREGMAAHRLYFIHSGTVKTFRTTKAGKEFITGMFGAGDFIGQLSLLNKTGQYLDTAMVIKDTEAYSISKNDFMKLLLDNNEISNKFIGIISNDLVEVQDKLINMAYASVRKRAAKALLSLNNKGLVNDLDNRAIAIPREDFAGIIGTATETAIRTLSEFKDEGLLKMDSSRRIILIDTEELEFIADSE